jgi:large subunit ribosomal protein L21e
MPFPRFKGRMGKIVEKRGKSYVVEILDGNKMKKIVSRPEHLKVI